MTAWIAALVLWAPLADVAIGDSAVGRVGRCSCHNDACEEWSPTLEARIEQVDGRYAIHVDASRPRDAGRARRVLDACLRR